MTNGHGNGGHSMPYQAAPRRLAPDVRGQLAPGRWTVACEADADEFGYRCFRARGSHHRELFGEVKDPANIPLLLAGWQRAEDPPDPHTWTVELQTLERGDHRLSDTDGTQPTLEELHAQLYAATEQLTAIETRIAACREEWDGHTADEVIRKHAEAVTSVERSALSGSTRAPSSAPSTRRGERSIGARKASG